MGGFFSKQKKLLILDMNKLLVTRIYAPKIAEEHPYAIPYVDIADKLGEHYTWKRPELEAFIEYCLDNFDVAVWSSAWRKNVDLLVDYVFKDRRSELVFEWDQEHCNAVDVGEDKPLFEKNLLRVWDTFTRYSPSNTIILDDSDQKMRNNPDQCVGICEAWTPWSMAPVETLDEVIEWLEDRK